MAGRGNPALAAYKWKPGQSGNPGGSPERARRDLNAATIREMHRAFRDGGRDAIDKVMKTQPATFLKLLVLLVPREMHVEHSSTVKAMSDEQLERAIEAVQAMLAAREANTAAEAKTIEGTIEAPALPARVPSPPKPKTPRGPRKRVLTPRVVGTDVGTERDTPNS